MEGDLNVQRSPCDLVVPKSAKAQPYQMDCADAHRVLLPTGETSSLGESGDNPCASLQSRVSLPYPPLLSVPFLPSPSLEVNSSSTPWRVAQGELVVPISLRHCSFLPSSQVQTAFPVASHTGYSFAGTGRTEPCRQGQGSFCNRDLGTDLRHCDRWGKSKTRDV